MLAIHAARPGGRLCQQQVDPRDKGQATLPASGNITRQCPFASNTNGLLAMMALSTQQAAGRAEPLRQFASAGEQPSCALASARHYYRRVGEQLSVSERCIGLLFFYDLTSSLPSGASGTPRLSQS
jgi:hypothetical protein